MSKPQPASAPAATSAKATQARPAQDSAWTAAGMLAGIIVPGGGHLLLGQTLKAVLFALALLSTMAIGLHKGQYANYTAQAQERHPVMYVLQYFTGGPALLAQLNTPETAEASPVFEEPSQFEIAVLFTAVAGLLNLLVLFDLIGLPQRIRDQAEAEKAKKPGTNGKPSENRGPPANDPASTKDEKQANDPARESQAQQPGNR